jgi:hypothetical protein
VLPRVAHTRLAEGFDGLCKLPELFFSDELCRAVGRGDLQEQAQRKHVLKVMQRGFKMRAWDCEIGVRRRS